MDLWALILAAVVCLIVYCYEGIIVDLIGWAGHKLKHWNHPKLENTH